MSTSTNGSANKWFENTVHHTTSNASDRIKKIRNRAIYQNTMNIALQGGLKHSKTIRTATEARYAPATLLSSKCVTNDCASFFIRSAPSYENLLRTTQGIYEGRALRKAQGAIPRTYKPPISQLNEDTVHSTGSANPVSNLNRYNYLNLNSSNGGATTDVLKLSSPSMQNAAYEASRKMPIDPAECMQYPPNPSLSITYGGGGCLSSNNGAG